MTPTAPSPPATLTPLPLPPPQPQSTFFVDWQCYEPEMEGGTPDLDREARRCVTFGETGVNAVARGDDEQLVSWGTCCGLQTKVISTKFLKCD